MDPQNTALWMAKRGAPLVAGPAEYSHPGPDEVVVRVRAVAVNPIDAMPGSAYRFVVPWLTFPAVIGNDVAGEVVEVGANVIRLRVGDRVTGHAVGVEQSRNSAAEGAFQHYVVLMQQMVAPIPDVVAFERAAVLPLTLSTAATGMFERDGLALRLPAVGTPDRDEFVLVWGASTSVGSNAVQLACGAGYRVLATSSPRNFDYVRSLGAEAAVDRTSRTAVDDLVRLIGASPLAGTIAIGAGSLAPAVAIASRTAGSRRISTSMPPALARFQRWRGRRAGVRISGIWGGSLKDDEVGPAIYVDYLPAALAAGEYRPAPEPTVVGHGLEAIPGALAQLRSGVSAAKLVVTL